MTAPAGKRYFIVDEDELRQKLLELSPEIRRDTDRMADLIRELVNLEREKRGLDKPRGTLKLCFQEKKRVSDPDVTGSGYAAGRSYRAAGWISPDGKNLRIALLPPKRK